MICWHIMLLWLKEGGGLQFGRVINGLNANISHPVVLYNDNNVYEGKTNEKRVMISVNKMIE